MAVVDLEDIVEQRNAQIEEDYADVRTDETYFFGESGVWCLLVLLGKGSGEVLEYEFIETAESWRRPDAVLEYNEAAYERVDVVIVVPDQSLEEVAELVTRAGNPEIIISDYSAMELVPRVLVS
jgi:hypothetical protein